MREEKKTTILKKKNIYFENMKFRFVVICLFFLIILGIILALVFTLDHQTPFEPTIMNENDFLALQNSIDNIPKTFEIMKFPMILRSGNFTNVLYYCPKIKAKTFQQMIAIENETKDIIAGSNSFLTDELFTQSYNEIYEKTYGVYGGLLTSYETIQKQPIAESIKDRIIMISNSFTGTNSGHDLGTLLATLIYIQENNLMQYQLGIQELGFKFPRILEILQLFYDNNWKVFDSDIVYHFDSIDFITVSPRFVIDEYKNNKTIQLIEEIKERSEFYMISQGCSPPHQSRILLIKQVHNTSARTHDAFDGAAFLAQMNEAGWIILNPEFDDMRYMICVLSHASHIVVSYGAIMWTHQLFFNPEANITHLQIGDEIAYDPVLNMKHFNKILITDTYLDSDTNKNLFPVLNSI